MKKLLYVLASLIFVSAIGAFAAACKPDEPETPPENCLKGGKTDENGICT